MQADYTQADYTQADYTQAVRAEVSEPAVLPAPKPHVADL